MHELHLHLPCNVLTLNILSSYSAFTLYLHRTYSVLTPYLLCTYTVRAGLPAGALNVVSGLGKDAGSPLSKHTGIDKISFTGRRNE